jgi:hypothetical protein
MRVVRSRRSCFAQALRALLGGISALLVGCNGNNIFTPGTPVVTWGESNNSKDFAAYIVSVDSITVTDTNGNIVPVLSTPEVVDLAQLNGNVEFVEAPALPVATYTSASFTLDYTSASIWVYVNGLPVQVTPLATNGTVMSTEIVTVTFDPAHPLVITNNQSTRLHIDVDLAASNSIDALASPPKLIVQPFLVMMPAPVDATVMRARGLFVTTQTVASGFIMNMQPFYDLVSALGAVTVNTDAHTYFNINGVTYIGAAGLPAMTALQEDTSTAAYGTLDDLSGITPSFNATAVYAGTSLENPIAESITGVVSSRSGSTINVRGATYRVPSGFFYPPFINGIPVEIGYYANVPVTLGESTVVSEDGVAVPGLSATSVSVGQQITVSGQATVDTSTNDTPTSMDATAGQVRLQSTRLWGTVNSATAGSASLDLRSLGDFPLNGFNFAGTGAAGQNATPAAYKVNTGSLNEGALTGTLLQVDGVVTPFGSAPPDFTAAAITPGASTLEQLVVEWENGASATAPFTSASAAGLVVNLANPDLTTVRYIRIGPTSVDLKALRASPLITTVGANQSELQLAVGSATLVTTGISVFNSAAAFASGLAKALNGTNRVFRLVAYGEYDNATNTFVAPRIYVSLQESP